MAELAAVIIEALKEIENRGRKPSVVWTGEQWAVVMLRDGEVGERVHLESVPTTDFRHSVFSRLTQEEGARRAYLNDPLFHTLAKLVRRHEHEMDGVVLLGRLLAQVVQVKEEWGRGAAAAAILRELDSPDIPPRA